MILYYINIECGVGESGHKGRMDGDKCSCWIGFASFKPSLGDSVVPQQINPIQTMS